MAVSHCQSYGCIASIDKEKLSRFVEPMKDDYYTSAINEMLNLHIDLCLHQIDDLGTEKTSKLLTQQPAKLRDYLGNDVSLDTESVFENIDALRFREKLKKNAETRRQRLTRHQASRLCHRLNDKLYCI